eukprot:5071097-Prymnesium_polylepis.1
MDRHSCGHSVGQSGSGWPCGPYGDAATATAATATTVATAATAATAALQQSYSDPFDHTSAQGTT